MEQRREQERADKEARDARERQEKEARRLAAVAEAKARAAQEVRACGVTCAFAAQEYYCCTAVAVGCLCVSAGVFFLFFLYSMYVYLARGV